MSVSNAFVILMLIIVMYSFINEVKIDQQFSCIDGVEYFEYQKTPKYNIDGTIKLCQGN